MEDWFRAKVKIPYWISVPETYAAASGVATLTFLCSKGILVPEVYKWSSMTENPFSVEYIIMEHALGFALILVGSTTRNTKNMCWWQGLLTLRKSHNITFSAVESLSFKSDLLVQLYGPLYVVGMLDEAGGFETYCIRLVADCMFWYGQRAKPELGRGLCMLFLL